MIEKDKINFQLYLIFTYVFGLFMGWIIINDFLGFIAASIGFTIGMFLFDYIVERFNKDGNKIH